MPTDGLRAANVVRLAPQGSISTDTANQILQQSNSIPVLKPVEPVTQVVPSNPVRAVDFDTSPAPETAAPGQSVTVTTETGSGLMAWAKANPLPAIAIAGATVYLIYTLTKRK